VKLLFKMRGASIAGLHFLGKQQIGSGTMVKPLREFGDKGTFQIAI